MRRAVAILIAMLFSLTLIMPVFAGTAASNLPACCRNTGKHHCQMKPAAGFAALGQKCTVFPHANAFPPITASNLKSGRAIFVGLVSNPVDSAQIAAGHRASHACAKQERGPPSFLS